MVLVCVHVCAYDDADGTHGGAHEDDSAGEGDCEDEDNDEGAGAGNDGVDRGKPGVRGGEGAIQVAKVRVWARLRG